MPPDVEPPHPGLAWLAGSPSGRAWLNRLPRLLDECAAQWSLRLEKPFAYAFASLVLPARTAGGEEVVLKLGFPDRESEHEGAALARWNGDGAVSLLASDAERRALLLERCQPGTALSEFEAGAALEVLTGLLPRLWVPTGRPFRTLAEEAAWWASSLPRQYEDAGRPFDRRLLDTALDALHVLAPSQGEAVLLHQDLHGDNVLRAEREPWLVIDPKPLVGEREFGIAPIVRSPELGHSRREVVGRLDRLTGALGLDRERARLWTLAQTIAWSDCRHARHIEIADWLLTA